MSELIPDPELERLIHEMNREDGGDAGVAGQSRQALALDVPDLREVHGDEPLDAILSEMVGRRASDLLLLPGTAPVVRVNGKLESLRLAKLGEDSVIALFEMHMGARSRRQLEETGSTDFSLRLAGSADRSAWRLRVNLQRQGGRLAAAIRALPRRIPSFDELNLPPSLGDMVLASNGLILVCGPTGSGKTTTLAAMLDSINQTEFRHVITIEDPVEYEHTNRRSVFEQVEIGSDAPGFSTALRAALRRDPDVILVGEMRDLETISIVLTAAETGHLVLSTLHTADSARAVNRIVDVFPASQQEQIRHQLALSLSGIVCQQLLPAKGGGRIPAVEILTATYAVRNHVRKGLTDRLYNELVAGRSHGMRTMEQSLVELVGSGIITSEVAKSRSSRPDELIRMLG